jgi:hypothetical protein
VGGGELSFPRESDAEVITGGVIMLPEKGREGKGRVRIRGSSFHTVPRNLRFTIMSILRVSQEHLTR